MLNKSIFGLGLGLSLLLSACGGPESDFRKYGRLACEMRNEVNRLNKKYPNMDSDETQRTAALKEMETWQKQAETFQNSLITKYEKQLNADPIFAKQMFGYIAEEMKKCGIEAPLDNIGENSSSSEQGIDDAIRILEALKSDDEEAFPKPKVPTPNEPEMPEMPEMENTVTNTSSSKQVTTSTRTESVTINGKTTSKTTTTSTTVTGN